MVRTRLLGFCLAGLFGCGGTTTTQPLTAPDDAQPDGLAFRPVDGSSYAIYTRHVIEDASGLPAWTYEIEGRVGMRRAERDITEVTIYVDTVRLVRDRDDDTYPYDGQLQILGRRDARHEWLGEPQFQITPDFDARNIRRFQALESFGRLHGQLVSSGTQARVGATWDATLRLDTGHLIGPPMAVLGRTQLLAANESGTTLATSFDGEADVGGVYTSHVRSAGTVRTVLEPITGVPLDVDAVTSFTLTRTLADGTTSGPYEYRVRTLQLVRATPAALAQARREQVEESAEGKALDTECREQRAALRDRIAASPQSIWLPTEPLPILPDGVESVRVEGFGWTRITSRTRTTDSVRAESGIVVVLPADTPIQDFFDKLPAGEARAMFVVQDTSLEAATRPSELARVTPLGSDPGSEQLGTWRTVLLEAIGVCPAARQSMREMLLSWQNTRGDALRETATAGMAACNCTSLRPDVLVALAEIGYGGPETVAVLATLDTTDSKQATPLRLPSTATYQDFIDALPRIDRSRPIHLSVLRRGRPLPPPPVPWTRVQARAVELDHACGDAGAITSDADRYTISLRCWDLLRSSHSPLRAFALSTDHHGGVVLHGVRRDSLEARLGLINGDVIRAINGHDVVDLATLVRVAAWVSEEHQLVFNIVRRGAPHVFTYALAGTPPRGED